MCAYVAGMVYNDSLCAFSFWLQAHTILYHLIVHRAVQGRLLTAAGNVKHGGHAGNTVILSFFILPFFPLLPSIHVFIDPRAFSATMKSTCQFPGPETKGDASSQHAPLRDLSRLPRHMSVRGSVSNYNSLSYIRSYTCTQPPPHTHTSFP